MKNKIEDLRNHLFATLEQLTDPDPEQKMDLDRAKAVCAVSKQIIDSARVEVDFIRVSQDASAQGSGFIPATPRAPGLIGRD